MSMAPKAVPAIRSRRVIPDLARSGPHGNKRRPPEIPRRRGESSGSVESVRKCKSQLLARLSRSKLNHRDRGSLANRGFPPPLPNLVGLTGARNSPGRHSPHTQLPVRRPGIASSAGGEEPVSVRAEAHADDPLGHFEFLERP